MSIDSEKYREEFDGVPCTAETYDWLVNLEEEWHNEDELLFDCGPPPGTYWDYLRMGGRMSVLQHKIVLAAIWQHEHEIHYLTAQVAELEDTITKQATTIRSMEVALAGQKYPAEKLRNLANHLLSLAASLEEREND